jgi:hypothetical protein
MGDWVKETVLFLETGLLPVELQQLAMGNSLPLTQVGGRGEEDLEEGSLLPNAPLPVCPPLWNSLHFFGPSTILGWGPITTLGWDSGPLPVPSQPFTMASSWNQCCFGTVADGWLSQNSLGNPSPAFQLGSLACRLLGLDSLSSLTHRCPDLLFCLLGLPKDQCLIGVSAYRK